MNTAQCPECGSLPSIDSPRHHFYTAICPECYDGAPDSPPQMGHGTDPEEAIEDWLDTVSPTCKVCEEIFVYGDIWEDEMLCSEECARREKQHQFEGYCDEKRAHMKEEGF